MARQCTCTTVESIKVFSNQSKNVCLAFKHVLCAVGAVVSDHRIAPTRTFASLEAQYGAHDRWLVVHLGRPENVNLEKAV